MTISNFNPGTIRLHDRPYVIDIESWQGRDITDFSPRASVPGGAVVHSQLGLYQPMLQTDWRHGFGFHWYRDEAGYMRTDGRVDTRQDGLTMLFTNRTQDDVNTSNAVEGFTAWNNAAWAWGAGGLYKYSGGSWSNVYSANAVNFALASGDYLFYCPDGARIRKVNTSDTHSDAGSGSNSTDYSWLAMHKGFIYAGKDDKNEVYYGSSSDLSDLEGDPADDTNEIYVGFSGMETIGAVSFAGRLLISKADGLYQLSEDNQTAIKILDFSEQLSADNFRFLEVVNGKMVFPIRDELFEWNGQRLTPITPPKLNDQFPYTTYGRFIHGVAVGKYFYCIARTNESTYEEHLISYDGTGWHKLEETITNGTDSVSGMGYDVVNNYLWYHIDAGTDESYYIQFQDQSTFPHANFPTSGTHSLITSRLAMGFRWVDKTLSSIFIEAVNCDSGTYIDVYYSIDGGSWVNWDKVTSDGITKLTEPGGNDAIEFKNIRFRFDFVTDDTAQSPVLEGYTTRFMMRPDVSFGYVFDVVMSGELDHGQFHDLRSAKEIKDDLRTARRAKSPIVLVTPYGEEVNGFVTALNEHLIEEHPRARGGHPDIEGIVRVNFAETDQS